MFEYAVEKYGFEQCSLVSTFQMRKAKAALRSTARVLGVDLETADTAAKLIPTVYYEDDGEKTTDLSIQESLDRVPELALIRDEYPAWFDMAMKLEGLPSATSIHAAGILISPVSLTDKIPLIRSNKDGILATALNLGDAEDAGMVKFDFLSLATLKVIEKTQQDVNIEFDYQNNKFDDKKVWDILGTRYTTGLFQISSKTYKDRMPRLKPTTIQELAACLALVRGPCISNGSDKVYMEICENKRSIEPVHPLYYEITKDTNCITLYQEQVMQLAVSFGFSLDLGYDLVKAISKKNIEKIKAFEAKFKANAKSLKVDSVIADLIWQIIYDAGLYSFNRSHALCYALVCYCSAYLKAYYPREFLTNLITNAFERGKNEEVLEIINDCRRLGIKFLPLDVNLSEWEFKLEEDGIRIGFCAVKSFGAKATEEVLTKRPFTSLDCFMEQVEKGKCNKRSLVAGIFAGMFDCFGESRKETYELYMAYRKEEPLTTITLQSKETFNTNDSLDTFEEIMLRGQFISDPSNNFEGIGFDLLKRNAVVDIQAYIKAVKNIKDTRGNPMCFLRLGTGDGDIECTVFSNLLTLHKKSLKKKSTLVLKVKKDKDCSCILQGLVA